MNEFFGHDDVFLARREQIETIFLWNLPQALSKPSTEREWLLDLLANELACHNICDEPLEVGICKVISHAVLKNASIDAQKCTYAQAVAHKLAQSYLR